MNRDDVEKMMDEKLDAYTLRLSAHLTETVQGAVKATVNGKIDDLHRKVDPIVEIFNNLTSTQKVLLSIFKGILMLSAVIVAIIALIKFVFFLGTYDK